MFLCVDVLHNIVKLYLVEKENQCHPHTNYPFIHFSVCVVNQALETGDLINPFFRMQFFFASLFTDIRNLDNFLPAQYEINPHQNYHTELTLARAQLNLIIDGYFSKASIVEDWMLTMNPTHEYFLRFFYFCKLYHGIGDVYRMIQQED